MKRTTITMPDELADLVAREARRRDTSVSGLVRSLVERGLNLSSEAPRVIPWAGMFDDPEAPAAARLDDEVKKHWADDIDRDRR